MEPGTFEFRCDVHPDDDRHGRGHLSTSVGAPRRAPPRTLGAPPRTSPARHAPSFSWSWWRSRVAGRRLRCCARRPIRVRTAASRCSTTPFPGLHGEAVVGPPLDTASMDWSVLVVNVWATWCEPCRREQPALQQVQAAYADRGVEFVGVDYRDDRAAAERWIEDFDVTYPSLYDPDGRTAASLELPVRARHVPRRRVGHDALRDLRRDERRGALRADRRAAGAPVERRDASARSRRPRRGRRRRTAPPGRRSST